MWNLAVLGGLNVILYALSTMVLGGVGGVCDTDSWEGNSVYMKNINCVQPKHPYPYNINWLLFKLEHTSKQLFS